MKPIYLAILPILCALFFTQPVVAGDSLIVGKVTSVGRESIRVRPLTVGTTMGGVLAGTLANMSGKKIIVPCLSRCEHLKKGQRVTVSITKRGGKYFYSLKGYK